MLGRKTQAFTDHKRALPQYKTSANLQLLASGKIKYHNAAHVIFHCTSETQHFPK